MEVSLPTVAMTVYVPVTALEKVTLAVPPEVIAVVDERFPPLGAAKTTVVPSAAGVPSDFLTVAVMVTSMPTAAVEGFAETVTPEANATVTLLEITPVEALTVQLIAEALVRVTDAIPPTVVAENADSVPPTVVKETSVPSATGVPSAFLTVAVMVTVELTTGEVEDAVTVMDAGESGPIAGNHSTEPQPLSIITRKVSSQIPLPISPPNG